MGKGKLKNYMNVRPIQYSSFSGLKSGLRLSTSYGVTARFVVMLGEGYSNLFLKFRYLGDSRAGNSVCAYPYFFSTNRSFYFVRFNYSELPSSINEFL